MLRCLVCMVFACVPLLALAAPIPKESDAARMRRIYGEPENFTDSERVEMEGNKLRIFVGLPGEKDRFGTTPALLTDHTPRDSSRVWRTVKGDFTVTARVVFANEPSRLAGLVAWEDAENFAAVYRERNGNSVSLRSAQPNHGNSYSADFKKPPAELFLRLRREEQIATGEYSLDGKKWQQLTFHNVLWGDTIKVGLFVKDQSGKASSTIFDEYKLTQPQK